MAPKFASFTKGSKLPLNQGFQNRFLVTTVSRQALDIYSSVSEDYTQSQTIARITHTHLHQMRIPIDLTQSTAFAFTLTDVELK